MRIARCLHLAVLGLALFVPGKTIASNAVFQDFFFTACDSPTGALATRCGQTPDGEGDLSGNSETSLNPNQTVSSNQTPLANARDQIDRARERVAALEEDVDAQLDNTVSIGPFSLLFNGNYTWYEQDASNRERGFDGDSYGIELGFDRRISDRTVLGAFLGYEDSDFEFDKDEAGRNFTPQGDSGTNETETFSLVVFGAHDFNEEWYVEGSVGASLSEHEFQRNVVFQESTRTIEQTDVRVKGDPDGEAWWGSAGVGYRFSDGAWATTPYLSATYVSSEIDDYREKDLNDSGLAMFVDDDSRESLTTVLGIRSSYAIGTDWGVLVPQVSLDYEHEFEEDAQTTATSYVLDANRTTYRIKGDGPDRDYFNAGAGLVAIFAGGWIGFVNYEGLFGYEDRERHQITAGLRREL